MGYYSGRQIIMSEQNHYIRTDNFSITNSPLNLKQNLAAKPEFAKIMRLQYQNL